MTQRKARMPQTTGEVRERLAKAIVLLAQRGGILTKEEKKEIKNAQAAAAAATKDIRRMIRETRKGK